MPTNQFGGVGSVVVWCAACTSECTRTRRRKRWSTWSWTPWWRRTTCGEGCTPTALQTWMISFAWTTLSCAASKTREIRSKCRSTRCSCCGILSFNEWSHAWRYSGTYLLIPIVWRVVVLLCQNCRSHGHAEWWAEFHHLFIQIIPWSLLWSGDIQSRTSLHSGCVSGNNRACIGSGHNTSACFGRSRYNGDDHITRHYLLHQCFISSSPNPYYSSSFPATMLHL